jgi:uncharacterized membrane protein
MFQPHSLRIFRILAVIGALAGLLALAVLTLPSLTTKAPSTSIDFGDVSGLALAALIAVGVASWWIVRHVLKFQ